MDNWKYLVNTVGDLRFRQNDADTIGRVLDALAYVFEEKGAGGEALILQEQASNLRTTPRVIPSPCVEEEEEYDEEEEEEEDDDPLEEEGSLEGLIRNVRWFIGKLK